MLIFYSALLYLFLLMRFVCSFIPCICPCQAFADFCKINQEAYSLSLYSQCTRYNPTAGASPFWSTNLCARHSAQDLTFTNTFNPHNHLTQHVQLWSQFSWWGNRGSARLRRGRAGIQVQTGWLQGAGMHLLHREAYLYVWCGMLAAHMALWLLPSGVPGASWIRSFSLHHQFFVFFFLMQEAIGKEALMNFQRQLQFVWTRLSSVSQGYWHTGPAPNQFLLVQAFLWCLRVSTLAPAELAVPASLSFPLWN